ncbi:hypothetical protein D043_3440A, partial [Vibrio parahaemolyticus EKP-021]
MIAVHAGKA